MKKELLLQWQIGQINVPIQEGSTVLKAAQDAMNGWDPTNRMYLLF